ncbi:hypothetical protein [Pseudolysinimonas sp.]
MTTIEQCTVPSGLIIPDNIPGPDLKPGTLESVADTLRTAGSTAVAHAETAESTWGGLPAVLEAPEGPTIYAALGTPSTTASTIETKFDRVADALDEFAAALGPIRDTFAAITTDAVAFRATIRPDERVWVSPGETKEYEGNGLASVSTTGNYQSSYSTGSTQSEVLAYLRGRGETARAVGTQVEILAPWTESSEHVDQNNALMDRLADAYTTLQNAEADCANAINRQRELCMVEIEYIEAWELKQGGENTVMLPWGNRVDEDRNCGESFWWGVGSAGGEALSGLGTLIGRDPVSGNFSWEMAGQGWLGALQGIGTLLVITSPPLMLLGRAGVPVFSDAVNMGDEMVKGLLAWDTWAENPAEAAGRVLFNVGTIFIPGAGEISAAVKALTAGARVADVAIDVVRISDAATAGVARVEGLAVRLDGLAGDAAGAADDLVPAVGFRTPDIDIDVVRLPDDAAPPVRPPAGVGDPVIPVRPRPADDVAPPVRPQPDPAPPVHPQDGGAPPVRPQPDPTPPVRPRPDDDAAPPVRPGDDTPPPVRPGDDSAPPVRPGDDPTPPVRPDDDAAPPVRPDDDSTPPTRPDDDDAPPAGAGDDPLPVWPPRDVPDDHWSRDPLYDDPIFHDPNDPVVWVNDEYGTVLTASQRAAADEYMAFSRQVEPGITPALEAIAARHPDAWIDGLRYVLKGEESFYRKYATDIIEALRLDKPVDGVLAQINDSVRYTFFADDAAYASMATSIVADLRAAGFELVGTPKNFWLREEGYVGINSTWRDASGRLFEVQFHTPTSFHVKDVITHGWYEEARLPVTTAERLAELESLQNAAFDRVPHPPGAHDITWPGGDRP